MRVAAVLAASAVALGLIPGAARPAGSAQVTISVVSIFTQQPAFDVLVPNFERVFPNITVNITYTPSTTVRDQLETTELAAGNAPDVIQTNPGCGTAISVCELAKAGYLEPLLKAPWVKRSLPLITSLSKYGQGLFAFEPIVAPQGIFANDGLFDKLGLKVPQTFSQLLDVCRKAKAAGSSALLLPGASSLNVAALIVSLAVPNVYGADKRWAGKLRAGKVSFDTSPGWEQAFREFGEMNDAGCFQPGATGSSTASVFAQFAQGQGLMTQQVSSQKGSIDAGNPQFPYSFRPFPAGSNANQIVTYLKPGPALSVNARSSPQNQTAAQTFIDFIARPKQNALYAQTTGGLTQYQFLKDDLPSFMSGFEPLVRSDDYVVDPTASWWNPNVLLTLEQDGLGIITGQVSGDDVLGAMDTAWRQGPS